ncbi:Stf0 family sulfotransferase [Qipengyuania atrilutea]|uniref:Sulphotransferase Stf0 domain-containing protein n=1 Tax=Qipengyuania atrilutea TaxID=2744473 RepID=A0A850GYI4_9SPHN|nr:Stf0 family sulfotransferase [Actirhodobacter atriluteus]NVD43427.1 hypothetical protein [Actirhodobacter atriluteus]
MQLDGITTGYERKFDWPPYEGKPRPYLLASVPRTGSTYLSHLLWETGCLGAPLEYLNFEPSGPYGHVSNSPPGQLGLWQQVVPARTSPNGVFGLKAFPLQMELLGRSNPPLLARAMRFLLSGGAQSKVVQLRRRDTAAHAISLARASLRGIWRAEQESERRREPNYDAAVVEQAIRELAAQEDAWTQMYREMGIRPLVVWYEDVVANPDATVSDIAAYLSVELDPSLSVDVPSIERQDQSGTREWRRRLENE